MSYLMNLDELEDRINYLADVFGLEPRDVTKCQLIELPFPGDVENDASLT